MNLLSRHIVTEFLRFFLMTFIGILSVYLCVDFLQKADDFIRLKAHYRDIVAYFLYSIPAIATPSLPIAVLLATLLSLGNLSRSNEIVAMHAGGVSLSRIILPVFMTGLCLSLFGFVNNEIIMPPATARANAIRYDRIEKKRHLVLFQQRNLWLRGPDNSIVNIDFTPPDRSEMHGIQIYRMNPDFTVRDRISAERLVLEGGSWLLRNAHRFTLENERLVVKPVDGEAFNIVESPEDLKMIVKSSEEMSFAELWDYVRRLKSSGYHIVRYEVDLFDKLAFPLSSLVMVMVAAPLALHRVRSGGAGRGVAIAVFIAFAYWALKSVGKTFGHIGVLPPFLSAWTANLCFLAASSAILARMQAPR